MNLLPWILLIVMTAGVAGWAIGRYGWDAPIAWGHAREQNLGTSPAVVPPLYGW